MNHLKERCVLTALLLVMLAGHSACIRPTSERRSLHDAVQAYDSSRLSRAYPVDVYALDGTQIRPLMLFDDEVAVPRGSVQEAMRSRLRETPFEWTRSELDGAAGLWRLLGALEDSPADVEWRFDGRFRVVLYDGPVSPWHLLARKVHEAAEVSVYAAGPSVRVRFRRLPLEPVRHVRLSSFAPERADESGSTDTFQAIENEEWWLSTWEGRIPVDGEGKEYIVEVLWEQGVSEMRRLQFRPEDPVRAGNAPDGDTARRCVAEIEGWWGPSGMGLSSLPVRYSWEVGYFGIWSGMHWVAESGQIWISVNSGTVDDAWFRQTPRGRLRMLDAPADGLSMRYWWPVRWEDQRIRFTVSVP